MSAIEEIQKITEPTTVSGMRRSAEKIKTTTFAPPIVKNEELNKLKKSADKERKEVIQEIKKDKDETERTYLFGKLCDYFQSPTLSQKIPDNIKKPTDKTTLAELRMAHAAIQSAFTFAQKKQFVDKMFTLVCYASEKGAVQLLKDNSKVGLADNFLLPAKPVMFDADLEELAADLPNDYIPSAKFRIAMNLIMMAMSYDVRMKPVDISNSDEKSELKK